MKLQLTLAMLLIPGAILAAYSADGPDDLLAQAAAALRKGQPDEAVKLASRVVTQDPNNARAFLVRGSAQGVQRRPREAIADFDMAISLDPRLAEAHNRRGAEHFKQGRIEASIKDFDRFLELRPTEHPGHWMRGISLYYAGRFDDGRKQFAAYEKVDTNDVENAVWHYLCNARAVGTDKAREAMLKIGHDRRVPLMKVYDLFAGRAQAEDVLTSAKAGDVVPELRKQQLFYAHLYLGLYFESIGDIKKTLENLTLAAGDYRIDGYMGDVARVHRDRLTKSK